MKLRYISHTAIIAMTLFSTTGCIIHVGGHNDGRDGADHSSVFGGLNILENQIVEDVSSINGNINIKSGAKADDVETVNGNIELEKNIQVGELSTVNGDIQAKANLQVENDVSTVNGNISLASNSTVKDDVSTVNGDIELTSTTVGGDIETRNGSITLENGSVVEGNILFEERDQDKRWGNNSRLPTLTIDANSNVLGKIILEQKVVLEIENKALLAKVERRYNSEEE